MSVAELAPEAQQVLVNRLLERARAAGHPVEHRETHISHLLLIGPEAYKVKKPLDLGFLDFSTRARRHFFCEEELRINRRLAPDLYRAVVAIRGSVEQPMFGGTGPVLDYAVRMRRFDNRARLDRRAEDGALDPEALERFARTLAGFHAQADRAPAGSPYGAPTTVRRHVLDNFSTLRQALETVPSDPAHRAELEALEIGSREQLDTLESVMAERQRAGFVREGHGDMHLGNMVEQDGHIQLFDAIEFDPALRWIDTLNDLAFLMMDLHDHRRPRLAHRVVNAYLEASGDYTDLRLLTFYAVYRALVRAKVTGIHALQQANDTDRQPLMETLFGYLDLAGQLRAPSPPRLILTFGPSASGKSTQALRRVEASGAIRLRSDVERKRLHGLTPEARSDSGLGRGLYTPEATDATYARLLELAEAVLAAGWPVVIDATFAEGHRRRPFQALAERLGIPYLIDVLAFDPDELRRRVVARQAAGSDASEATRAVLEQQLAQWEPLSPEEEPFAHRVPGHSPADPGGWHPPQGDRRLG